MRGLMNKFEQQSIQSYNKKAKDYDNTADGRFTVKFKEKLLESVTIQKGDRVLDIGCGNGRLLNMFAEKSTFDGYGTDISTEMIKEARKQNPQMSFEVSRCDDLPFSDNTFDIITVCAAFHHFPDIHAFSKEAYRVLKPNGIIYIAEMYYPAIIRILCNPFFIFSKSGDVKIYSPKEIIKTLKATGLSEAAFIKSEHIQIIKAYKK